MKRNIKPVVDRIKEDARCKRLVNSFETAHLFKIPFEELSSEIFTIHKTRSIRFLNRNDGRFIENLVDASIRDQANRSRLAEISMQCFKAQSSLEDAIEKLREYLVLTYGPDISFVRTKEERKHVVELALSRPLSFVKSCIRLRTLADTVIADIDKGGWSLKLQLSAVELMNRPEHTV